MRLLPRLAAMTGLIALLTAAAVEAQPRWRLKVVPGEPGVVTIFDALDRPTSYWYFPFSVTNKTGSDQRVCLSAKALVDKKKTYLSGNYPKAEKRIEQLLGRKLRSGRELVGSMGNGETWSGVALFKGVDTSMDRISFQIRGTEDIIVRIRGVSYVEVRAIEFTYRQPGDEYYPWEDPIKYLGTRWSVLKQRTRVARRPAPGG